MLIDKIERAHQVIEAALSIAKSPAVACSFGKDSMVMLHLLRKHADMPVLFHREPFQHHKYAFANQVMNQWDLKVLDYPPLSAAVWEKDGEFEIVKSYQVGGKTILLPVGIRPPRKGERLVCGLIDIYGCLKGGVQYPFDAVFIGHKSSDVDPILGAIPLAADVSLQLGSPNILFPIRDFTDEDIWDYTEQFDLPIHHARYEKVDGRWRERESKDENPDYINACVDCMRKSSPPVVNCPKLGGLQVTNVSEQLAQAERPTFNYLAARS